MDTHKKLSVSNLNVICGLSVHVMTIPEEGWSWSIRYNVILPAAASDKTIFILTANLKLTFNYPSTQYLII